jgi:hypothetical protein
MQAVIEVHAHVPGFHLQALRPQVGSAEHQQQAGRQRYSEMSKYVKSRQTHPGFFHIHTLPQILQILRGLAVIFKALLIRYSTRAAYAMV